jgi:hypothetical protein
MTDRFRPGLLKTATDLFGKVQRDAALLHEGITSDRFFNFVVTAYSLIDWIKHDPTVPQSAKAPAAMKAIRRNPWLLLCGDAATGAKHFKLDQREPTAEMVSVLPSGYGVGRYGAGSFGGGEEHITVHLPDRTVYGALDLVEGVVEAWKAFFEQHGIPMPPAGG